MEKYESLVIVVIEFDADDVIITSDGVTTDPIRSFTTSLFHITNDTLFSYEWFLNNDGGEDE